MSILGINLIYYIRIIIYFVHVIFLESLDMFIQVIRTRSTGLALKNSTILASLTFTSVRPVYFLRRQKFVCGEVVQRWQNDLTAPLQL